MVGSTVVGSTVIGSTVVGQCKVVFKCVKPDKKEESISMQCSPISERVLLFRKFSVLCVLCSMFFVFDRAIQSTGYMMLTGKSQVLGEKPVSLHHKWTGLGSNSGVLFELYLNTRQESSSY